MSDRDPFNYPQQAHPKARDLMREIFFWDCAEEDAPFGSDEGWDAYYEWRSWRSENPTSEIKECMAWILSGRLDEYNESLYSDTQVETDIESPDDAFLSEEFGIYTLDTTIIATGLGQLIDEGKIDESAKPYLRVAVSRQLHPLLCERDERRVILEAVRRVIDAA
ncbi:MAG: molybdate metabolism regulator [Luteolibacter sp.]